MRIKKKDQSYNDYVLELSFGELVAISNGMSDFKGGGVVADEVRKGLQFYLDRIPGPGEDKDEFEAKQAAEKEAANAGKAAGAEVDNPGVLPAEDGGPDLEPAAEEIPEPPAE